MALQRDDRYKLLDTRLRLGILSTVSNLVLTPQSQTVILVNAAGGPRTITLPTAVGIKSRSFYIKKIDATANVVTVAAQPGQLIDGLASQPLAVQYNALQVVSDGGPPNTEFWSIISRNP